MWKRHCKLSKEQEASFIPIRDFYRNSNAITAMTSKKYGVSLRSTFDRIVSSCELELVSVNATLSDIFLRRER